MRSITSEQSEHSPKTIQSEADQKTAGESEAGQKEASGQPETGNSPGGTGEEEPQKKRKSDRNIHPSDAAVMSR